MKLPNKHGFTLIELSIVLVILGLIIGTLAPLFVTLTKKSKLTDGRQLVATARDELKGEIIRTRILPTNLTNIGHTIDPWQNPLVYIPAPNLAGQDICTWLAGGTQPDWPCRLPRWRLRYGQKKQYRLYNCLQQSQLQSTDGNSCEP